MLCRSGLWDVGSKFFLGDPVQAFVTLQSMRLDGNLSALVPLVEGRSGCLKQRRPAACSTTGRTAHQRVRVARFLETAFVRLTAAEAGAFIGLAAAQAVACAATVLGCGCMCFSFCLYVVDLAERGWSVDEVTQVLTAPRSEDRQQPGVLSCQSPAECELLTRAVGAEAQAVSIDTAAIAKLITRLDASNLRSTSASSSTAIDRNPDVAMSSS
jgi:hypothetical protein